MLTKAYGSEVLLSFDYAIIMSTGQKKNMLGAQRALISWNEGTLYYILRSIRNSFATPSKTVLD